MHWQRRESALAACRLVYYHYVSECTWGVQRKLWDRFRTRAIPERLRGVITTWHYTNPRLPLPLPSSLFIISQQGSPTASVLVTSVHPRKSKSVFTRFFYIIKPGGLPYLPNNIATCDTTKSQEIQLAFLSFTLLPHCCTAACDSMQVTHSPQRNVCRESSCVSTSTPSWCSSTTRPAEVSSSPATGQCSATTNIAYCRATASPLAAVSTPTPAMIMASHSTQCGSSFDVNVDHYEHIGMKRFSAPWSLANITNNHRHYFIMSEL